MIVFWRKILGKYFQLFSQIFSQIFFDFGKKKLISHGFIKLQKNLPKWKIWVGRACKTGFSFFHGLTGISLNYKYDLHYLGYCYSLDGFSSGWALQELLNKKLHSKITMAGEVVPYYTVTALVPTLK